MAIDATLLLSAIGIVCLQVSTAVPATKTTNQQKPHIIMIVADDLGWNDVSWHNSQVLSPHLEELARSGVILEQSYVQPVCTPTRSALLTGRYPYSLGRQRGVLYPEQPTGLTIKRKVLPQALKEAGYSTHAVGKWHLGFCSWDYTPTSRGFDTFWGFYTGKEDYYDHTRTSWLGKNELAGNDSVQYNKQQKQRETIRDSSIKFGFDFRNNTKPEYSVDGEYSTYLYSSYIETLLESRDANDPMFLYLPFQSVHAPLQVPENYTAPFSHLEDAGRRTKLGMVLAMDEAVGEVICALKTSGHYNNSVIVFTTDNGGPTRYSGNNWPLRGNKSTLWEGGTRGVAFVHSPILPYKGIVSEKLIHITDWFATLANLGGGDVPDDTHGFDQWEALTTSAPSPRKEMVYNIDYQHSIQQANAGIRVGDYKLLVGYPGPGEWIPPPEGNDSFTLINSDLETQNRIDLENNLTSTSELKEEMDMLILPEINTSDLRTEADVEDDSITLGDLGFDFVNGICGHLFSNTTTARLYNIKDDPEERQNLAPYNPNIVRTILGLLQHYMKDYVEPDIPANDPAANPVHWNNTWTPGWCHPK